MNKIMFDILLLIDKGEQYDVKLYAKILYKPYSIIEQEYFNLVHSGYVSESRLTEKGKEYLNSKKIDNAVILAAGVSSRFVPICYEKPKALLRVKGEIMIERQIEQLIEAGINEIHIVIGHMKEKFYYLKGKYGVNIIETDTYKTRNNHASVFAAKEYLKNTIITSADLYFTKNIFQKYAYDAYYCSVYIEGKTEERGIITNPYDKILKTGYGLSDTWVTLGYAYFNERFSKNFINIMNKEYNRAETLNKFWADIQDEHLQELYMYTKRCDNNVIYEFDSLEELRDFDKNYFEKTDSVLMQKISDYLHTSQGNLRFFKPITKEDLARGITFIFEQKRYICRITDNQEIRDIKRYTHEVFIYTDEETMNRIYSNSLRLGITLNKKNKELFKGFGIRLGVQEIARYGWSADVMKQIARIIKEISVKDVNDSYVHEMISGLPSKKIQYTFDEATASYFKRFLK